MFLLPGSRALKSNYGEWTSDEEAIVTFAFFLKIKENIIHATIKYHWLLNDIDNSSSRMTHPGLFEQTNRENEDFY